MSTTDPELGASAGESEKPEPKKRERKKDETPIEDLYDLSQPIPRVCLSCGCYECYCMLFMECLLTVAAC